MRSVSKWFAVSRRRTSRFWLIALLAVVASVGQSTSELRPPTPGRAASLVQDLVHSRPGPFNEKATSKPGQKQTFVAGTHPGPCAVQITPQGDAALTIKVTQNGQQAAAGFTGKGKKNFAARWFQPKFGSQIEVEILNTDSANRDFTINFTQPGKRFEFQPIKQKVTINPGDILLYEFGTKKVGPCTLQIKSDVNAKLRISIIQNGQLIQRDISDLAKKDFVLQWNAVDPPGGFCAILVYILSTDNKANNCTLNFSQP